MAKTRMKNRLGEFRKSKRIGATELARSVGVTRQTIYSIEAGTYIPNTEVALKIARLLETTVEELFSAEEGSRMSSGPLACELLSTAAPVKGQPVRISRIGSQWVSVPVSPI